MPRKRKTSELKSCEFCDCGMDGFYRIFSEDSDQVDAEIYPGHCIAFFANIYNEKTEEREEVRIEIPFNYCPNCGAKWTL